MPKKSGTNKSKANEVNADVDIISRTKITFEDTKSNTGADQEFKWGEIYQMIRDQNVLNIGIEEMSLCKNIKKAGITKVTTFLELFSCAEVIHWILPQTNPTTMIIANIEGKDFSSFAPVYIAMACKLPPL